MASPSKKRKPSSGSVILSRANNDFTSSLYKELLPDFTGNMIISGFSAHTVLGMTGQGARGDTRSEIVSGLKFDVKSTDEEIAAMYSSVLTNFYAGSSPETFTLLIANKIYCQTGFALNQSFVNLVKQEFISDFQQLDFSKSSKAAGIINQWVEDRTEKKINKNIVSSQQIDELTSLVLVNAIYFKGLWKDKFNYRSTKKQKFHVTPERHVMVDMMHRHGSYQYMDLPSKMNAHAIALPYKGDRLSMVIILPKEIDGLGKLQTNIGELLENGKSVISKTTPCRYVNLDLPKFKFETNTGNLRKVLEKMGMKLMFSRADFTGMLAQDNREGLYVSSVIQKAFIEVDEGGVTAAAATTVALIRRSTGVKEPKTIIEFVVDHPFYFQIVDNQNDNLVIFSGHCTHPTK